MWPVISGQMTASLLGIYLCKGSRLHLTANYVSAAQYSISSLILNDLETQITFCLDQRLPICSSSTSFLQSDLWQARIFENPMGVGQILFDHALSV